MVKKIYCLNLLDSDNYGMKFTIGKENKYVQLQNASVVSTQYNIGGKFGAIGVIGPTRMDYSKVYSQIEYVSSLVGTLMERILKGD